MAGSSQDYLYTGKTSSQTAHTRLLWRGSLVNQTGLRLHGLAIVAHSINPKAASQEKSDPFAADSYSHTLGDTCLAIEMLRGSDLQVDKITQLTINPVQDFSQDQEPQTGSRKSRVASLLKGKETGNNHPNRGIPFSEIECDPEVRLYVDPRCSQTHQWILSQLGKRELTPDGFTSDALILRLDPSADDQNSSQLVIFGRAVEEDSAQPSTSDAVVPLKLVIGQRKPRLNQPTPRPDDPMPRVMPSLLFTDSTKFGIKKSTGTLLNNKSHLHARTIYGQTLNPSNVHSLSERKNSDQTHMSGLDMSKTHGPNSRKRNLKTTKRPANTPGRRMNPETSLQDEDLLAYTRTKSVESLSPKRSEKRKSTNNSSQSTKKMKTSTKAAPNGRQFVDLLATVEETEGEQDADGMSYANDFPVGRSPSPSPSPFRYPPKLHGRIPPPHRLTPSLGPNQHKLDDSVEPPKAVRFRPFPPKDLPKTRNSPALPVPKDTPPNDLLAPTNQDPPETSYLHQNKMLIRKMASESLNSRGLYKDDSTFKDLSGAVCRGVQFALRGALDRQPIDIHLTRTFVESHLAMYMILNNNNTYSK